MLAVAVALPDMAARKVEQRKKAISVTLTAAHIEALEAMAAKMEFAPSVSQLVDRAIAEFIAARQAAAKKTAKP